MKIIVVRLSALILTLFIVLLLQGCSIFGNSTKAINKDVDFIESYTGDKLEITKVDDVGVIQYARDGNIHIFGYIRNENNQVIGHELLVYGKNFEFIDRKTITVNTNSRNWFVDENSNFILIGGNDSYMYTRPDYIRERIPYDTIYNDLLPYLQKQNETNKKEISSALALLFKKQFPLETVQINTFGQHIFIRGVDDSYTYLPAIQTADAKFSTFSYFPRNKHWGQSLKHLIDSEPIYTTSEGFIVTEKKSIRQNRPNKGYTKGDHYYGVDFQGVSTNIKVEALKNNVGIREVSDTTSTVMFLVTHSTTGPGIWYVVKKIK